MNNEKQIIQDRDNAILTARKIIAEPYRVLDTETTGLADEGGQVCQIGIVQSDGKQFESFVNKTVPITNEANRINHILDYDCEDAPDILEILKNEISPGMNTVIYNRTFDLKALQNSVEAKGGEFDRYSLGKVYDAMRIFAAFYGEWHDYFDDYKWKKLIRACYLCGIELDLPCHNALSDAIMTNEIIKFIAKQKLSTE